MLEERGPLAASAVAELVHLSRATVTGILARLELRGLVDRRPAPHDRRSVLVELSDLGRGVLARAPSLLQDRFRRRLAALEEWEQLAVLATLQRIASMMDATDLDASPHLVSRSEDLASTSDETDEPDSPSTAMETNA